MCGYTQVDGGTVLRKPQVVTDVFYQTQVVTSLYVETASFYAYDGFRKF